MCKRYLLLAVLSLAGLTVSAQRKRSSKAPAVPPASVGSTPAASKTAPRPYNDVITSKAVTDSGLFKVHKIEDKFFFELSDSLLGRDVLIVNRISKAAADGREKMLGYGGDQINENVVRFEKGPNNKLFLKIISYSERAADTTMNGMYRSVINSNLQPIAASFDVKAYHYTDTINKVTTATVIDVTEYISGDNDVLFFDASVKSFLKLGAYQPDKSYIQEIRSFPGNIEIKTVKTYMKTPPPGMSSGGPATYELNSSIMLLPETPMQPRYFDNRVGYFATGYTDFDANPQGIKKISMITRWKLEPKPEDVEKYQRGELVEPKKPIVFYIDPATPRKWVPYLIQGVNDWQIAFEQAGFKNAIIAKEAPLNDPEWSLDDASHSAIVYKPSDVPNASGPHVHDPRSGEILETHINWYHNVMQLLRNWYMIQVANVDPRSRKMNFDDELMGQLIRFVSSHEVGHTLGLRHNFGSSSTVPVEKLRDKAWVEKYGHTPSIMDYARFNYVAQPEDNIGEAGIFPRINDYDMWAIDWGYRWKPEFKTAAAEKEWLNKWIIEKTGNNKRLWFGAEEYYPHDPSAYDPRRQNEDLGDNAMKAGAYGIKNLQRIVKNLQAWTKEPNESYSNLEMMYKEVVGQYYRYVGHVTKNIGGIMTTPKTVEQEGNVVEYVSRERQKEAMQFLNEQVFTTPAWLLNTDIFSKIGDIAMEVTEKIQDDVLTRLIGTPVLERLVKGQEMNGDKAYKVTEFFTDLNKAVWSELTTKKPASVYRRCLQKLYVEKLIDMMHPEAMLERIPESEVARSGGPAKIKDALKISDVISVTKAQARLLVAQIRAALPLTQDQVTKWHLQDVLERLTTALDTKK